MKGLALVVAVFAVGCVEEASEPRSCEPVLSVDGLRQDDTQDLDVPHDGTSYCLRVDTTTLTRPHLDLTTPWDTDFAVELRSLDNTPFATATEVLIGSTPSMSLTWDPAGGEIYDVLVHIEPRPPVIAGGTRVAAQLTTRP
jgi:hypothetical protein